jgi:lysophospholipase L1-like esterase
MSARTRRTAFARRSGRFLSRAVISSLLRTTQVARRTQFEVLGPARGRMVMLGDSITEGGNWDEWFPDSPVVNRGIGGELSAQVLARLPTAVDRPRAVFLLIGTNDLAFDIPQQEIAHNVESILGTIERTAPGTPVVLQSVMPRALPFRDEILALNQRYRDLVAAAAGHVRYLDLWPALATPEGALRPELTEDKLHLNGNGYAEWVGALRPIITEVGRPAGTDNPPLTPARDSGNVL